MLTDPSLLLAALLASGGGTEDGNPDGRNPDDTVVTARKLSEPLADVPLSVSTLDGS